MNFLRFLLFLSIILLGIACGEDAAEDSAPKTALEAPAPAVAIDGLQATLRWSRVDQARAYAYELYEEGAQTPLAQEEIHGISFTFEMRESVAYRFRVRAVPAAEGIYTVSAWSEEVRISNDMLPAPEVVLESVTLHGASLSWNAVDGAAAYYYELYAGDTEAPHRSGRTEERAVAFDDLTEGTACRFRVRALAPEAGPGEDSPFSAFTSFTTRSASALAAPAVATPVVKPGSVTLSWSAVEGAAGYAYELYKGYETAACKEAETVETQVAFDDLEPQTAYRFRVRALAGAGDEGAEDSDFSETVGFVALGEGAVDVGLPLPGEDDGRVRAFPGAEGGGMYATGGRGGKVYHVTTLEDNNDAGSLRHALAQSGPRTVVFDVAGTIRLTSDLTINRGDVTIAGQTAPGDGVCLRDYSVRVNADNVIIRYMRFRMGDVTRQENDAIWGRYHSNIILDHCSMSWSTDECASFYANCNFTMQWCLLTESLRISVHDKGKHGYGGIWGGRNASFHHNLLANHDSRNARIDHPGIYGSYLSTHRGNVDYRNNVIYNWGSNSTYGGEDGAYNVVGNYYKPGPASAKKNYFVDAYWYNSSSKVGTSYPRLYMEGNYHAGSYAAAINSDNWAGVYHHPQGDDPSKTAGRLSAPLPIRADDTAPCFTTTHLAADAFEAVVGHAGASLRRDGVDRRAETDARSGKATCTNGGNGSTDGLIDTQAAVGGWPQLTATADELARVKDSDGDGIPDYYENLLLLDKDDPADGNARTLDPRGLYTNLEVYLHYLVKEITAAQTAKGVYTELR